MHTIRINTKEFEELFKQAKKTGLSKTKPLNMISDNTGKYSINIQIRKINNHEHDKIIGGII